MLMSYNVIVYSNVYYCAHYLFVCIVYMYVINCKELIFINMVRSINDDQSMIVYLLICHAIKIKKLNKLFVPHVLRMTDVCVVCVSVYIHTYTKYI